MSEANRRRLIALLQEARNRTREETEKAIAAWRYGDNSARNLHANIASRNQKYGDNLLEKIDDLWLRRPYLTGVENCGKLNHPTVSSDHRAIKSKYWSHRANKN